MVYDPTHCFGEWHGKNRLGRSVFMGSGCRMGMATEPLQLLLCWNALHQSGLIRDFISHSLPVPMSPALYKHLPGCSRVMVSLYTSSHLLPSTSYSTGCRSLHSCVHCISFQMLEGLERTPSIPVTHLHLGFSCRQPHGFADTQMPRATCLVSTMHFELAVNTPQPTQLTRKYNTFAHRSAFLQSPMQSPKPRGSPTAVARNHL